MADISEWRSAFPHLRWNGHPLQNQQNEPTTSPAELEGYPAPCCVTVIGFPMCYANRGAFLKVSGLHVVWPVLFAVAGFD